MPEPNGDRVVLRAYFDPKDGRHKLVTEPETLRVCKSKTRVVSMALNNETVGTDQYQPVVLSYRINGGSAGKNSRDPKTVFDDCPNAPGSSFIVPDDGKPCYFTIKEHLGIKVRPTDRCMFKDDDPEYAVTVRFTHSGWDDAFGSGEHDPWHTEC